MATYFERRQHGPIYSAMLDLISNRIQQPPAGEASKSEGIAMEHRWGQRTKLDVQVRLHAAAWCASRHACLRDISASGALLETEPSLPPLKRIDVEIAVCKHGRMDLIRIPAWVVRKADHGVGVEWCEPLPVAVEQLVAGATHLIRPPVLPSRSTSSDIG